MPHLHCVALERHDALDEHIVVAADRQTKNTASEFASALRSTPLHSQQGLSAHTADWVEDDDVPRGGCPADMARTLV